MADLVNSYGNPIRLIMAGKFIDELFAQSCENEYHYNMAILASVLQSVRGLSLKSVTGDIRRPKLKRVIRVAAVWRIRFAGFN